MPLRIGFDLGGCLSKYPATFRQLFLALRDAPGVEIYVVSDMHPVEKIQKMLTDNGFFLPKERVLSADYQTHGELCKAVVCREMMIDILVDDFIGYLDTKGSPPVRLLVMPDSGLPYYADQWVTDGSEGNFGRRNPPGSKRPPENRGGKSRGEA